MNIKPIKNDDDLALAVRRMRSLRGAEIGSPEGDEIEILAALVEAYEDKHHAISAADPIEAIKFRMEQLGLKDSDLTPYVGQRSRVSEILNKKRALSLRMIRNLNTGLNIPLDALVKDYPLERETAQ